MACASIGKYAITLRIMVEIALNLGHFDISYFDFGMNSRDLSMTLTVFGVLLRIAQLPLDSLSLSLSLSMTETAELLSIYSSI